MQIARLLDALNRRVRGWCRECGSPIGVGATARNGLTFCSEKCSHAYAKACTVSAMDDAITLKIRTFDETAAALEALNIPDPRAELVAHGDESFSPAGWANEYVHGLEDDQLQFAIDWNERGAGWWYTIEIRIGALWHHVEGYATSTRKAHALGAAAVTAFARAHANPEAVLS